MRTLARTDRSRFDYSVRVALVTGRPSPPHPLPPARPPPAFCVSPAPARIQSRVELCAWTMSAAIHYNNNNNSVCSHFRRVRLDHPFHAHGEHSRRSVHNLTHLAHYILCNRQRQIEREDCVRFARTHVCHACSHIQIQIRVVPSNATEDATYTSSDVFPA